MRLKAAKTLLETNEALYPLIKPLLGFQAAPDAPYSRFIESSALKLSSDAAKGIFSKRNRRFLQGSRLFAFAVFIRL